VERAERRAKSGEWRGQSGEGRVESECYACRMKNLELRALRLRIES
jgi:hypothetical protein